jgi:pimeloyl-ACP methyl ester carboxylesterase
MSSVEINTQQLGANVFKLDPSQHPREDEGVFLDDAVVVPIDPANRVYEAFGSVQVGQSTSDYKGFFPENRTQEGVVLLESGFLGFLKSSEPLGRAFAEQGIAALVYDPGRCGDTLFDDWYRPHKLNVRTIEAVFRDAQQNPSIQSKVPEGRQAVREQQVIAAHSKGGLSAPYYVEKHPDDVELLVLIETVGINLPIMKQIITSVRNGDISHAKGEFKTMMDNGDIELNLKNLLRFMHYVGVPVPGKGRTRALRTAGEARACLRGDTRNVLSRLGAMCVPRLFIEGAHDVLIKAHPDIHDHVDRHVMLPDSGHMAPQMEPHLIASVTLQNRADMKNKRVVE